MATKVCFLRRTTCVLQQRVKIRQQPLLVLSDVFTRATDETETISRPLTSLPDLLNTAADTHVADEGLNQSNSEGGHIVLPILWRAKFWGAENP